MFGLKNMPAIMVRVLTGDATQLSGEERLIYVIQITQLAQVPRCGPLDMVRIYFSGKDYITVLESLCSLRVRIDNAFSDSLNPAKTSYQEDKKGV